MPRPYEMSNGAVNIIAFRYYKDLKRRLIVTYKNPLMRMTPDEFEAERMAVEATLQAQPFNVEARTKYELFQEVALDRS